MGSLDPGIEPMSPALYSASLPSEPPGKPHSLGEESESCSVLSSRPHGYTVHGILQARILEWIAFPFSKGPSQPRDRTQVSHIAGKFFTSWTIREALFTVYVWANESLLIKSWTACFQILRSRSSWIDWLKVYWKFPYQIQSHTFHLVVTQFPFKIRMTPNVTSSLIKGAIYVKS